ncbi:Tryptophan synthase alpha chain [Candidatus Gugararchaeum adminiculabundum]|nr:Tryptophan synthase alpha chain [Candidatus Gugararchaeum adminiculabundum]
MARFGVTGERSEMSPVTIEAVKRIKKVCKLPVYVGFGISTPEHVKLLKKAGADGAIIGSAIIKLLDEKDGIKRVADFTKELKLASE